MERLEGMDVIWSVLILFSKAYYSLKTRLIYGLFFGKVGPGCRIRRPLFIKNPRFIFLEGHNHIRDGVRMEGVDTWGEERFNPRLLLGDGVSLEQNCHITFASDLIIGAGTMILFDVMITDIDHGYEAIGVPILEQRIRVNTTRIGGGCFIGSGAKLQAGTILGRQCVIGANAVVRGEYPDYCVIVGSPATIIKRYDPNSGTWLRTNSKGDFLND